MFQNQITLNLKVPDIIKGSPWAKTVEYLGPKRKPYDNWDKKQIIKNWDTMPCKSSIS